MGRPRQHDQRTAAALLDAAEKAVQSGGVEAISVRGLAEEVGTTTRAVYSLFGSKDGLLVALATRGFEMLDRAVRAMPETDDCIGDLVEVAVRGFRPFATAHPALFRIGFKRNLVARELENQFDAARLTALGALQDKVNRLTNAGLLNGRPVANAVCTFHALCEGLADMELRGALPSGAEEPIWRDAFTALVSGLALPPPKPTRTRAADTAASERPRSGRGAAPTQRRAGEKP